MADQARVARADPDLLLLNGKVITVDRSFGIAQAIAIQANRILAVGANREIAPLAGPTTTVIDLVGKAVLPGFIDTHGHIGLFGIETLWVSLAGATSIDEICRRIAARVDETPAGGWVITAPVGDPPWFFRVPEVLNERRFPNRWDLDAVSAHHPVYITAPTNRVPNTAVLNSRALELAGINRETPREYEGIEVVKDPASGDPTGELRGMQPIYNPSRFFARFSRMLPPLTYDDILRGIRNLAPVFVANGTTTLLEAHLTSPEELRAYVELERRGELGLRVFYTFDIDPSKPLDQIDDYLRTISFAADRGFGSDRVRIAGVSIGLDGPHWHGSAVTGEPYLGPYGKLVDPEPLIPPDTYAAILKIAARYGLRVHAEAAGRGSIGIALAAMEQVDRLRPINDLRFVIEHVEFPTRQQILECKRLGIVPTTATNFIWGKGAEVYLDRLGAKYAAEAIPLRSWLDAGVPVAQSTDWGPREALFTLWQSLARRAGLTGEVIGPDQRISREEAIRIFTYNGAYALRMEDQLGSIEPGKLADLVILSADPLTASEDAIREIKVLATIIDGRVAYQSEDFCI
ncbi:MAG TPA: amidohydrolase family protein [Candidatus Binataceae bacterium]|nr:amidohydrolase family protein [Candidatus Binataceae bacterium]